MSDEQVSDQVEEQVQEPSADDVLAGELSELFALQLDRLAQWDLCLIAESDNFIDVLRYLRDKKSFAVLLDITAVDYLSFPGHRDERFAVVYLLKNLETCQRICIKVMVEEDEARLQTVCRLWKNANWLEREVFDQYGIHFQGHPNLKRILNHHQFVGHPLRKDYPVQKRQKLSVNDPMLDQLHQRLEENGYIIIEEAKPGESIQFGEQA